MNLIQYRDYIVRPVLERLGAGGRRAERMVIFTGLVETGFYHLHQLDNGPAGSFYQIEPETHDCILQWLLARRPEMFKEVRRLLLKDMDLLQQLHGNLYYATAICRAFYLRFPEALPQQDDLEGMARYWKRYYNTSAGAGTIAGAVSKGAKVLGL
jgi:hypothetical protein